MGPQSMPKIYVSTETKRHQLRRCFVSAPFGCNVSAITQVLNDEGISARQADNLRPGELILEAVFNEIRAADVICVVLPNGRPPLNQIFELGAAVGARIPAIILAESEVQLPSDLMGLPYARISLANSKTIDIAVRGFLKSLSKPIRRIQKPASRNATKISRSRAMVEFETLPKGSGSERALAFERFVIALLAQAGIPAVSQSGSPDKGVDLAIWLDEVENSIGNPILAELKANKMPPHLWQKVVDRLRQSLLQTHSYCGLVISGGELPSQASAVIPSMPLIMAFSAYDLIDLLSKGELPAEIIRRRNMAVHGKLA
jgi:hypothetical protein